MRGNIDVTYRLINYLHVYSLIWLSTLSNYRIRGRLLFDCVNVTSNIVYTQTISGVQSACSISTTHLTQPCLGDTWSSWRSLMLVSCNNKMLVSIYSSKDVNMSYKHLTLIAILHWHIKVDNCYHESILSSTNKQVLISFFIIRPYF